MIIIIIVIIIFIIIITKCYHFIKYSIETDRVHIIFQFQPSIHAPFIIPVRPSVRPSARPSVLPICIVRGWRGIVEKEHCKFSRWNNVVMPFLVVEYGITKMLELEETAINITF